MKETDFINELIQHILEGTKIPKVQVERAIGPILGFFVESILDKYFENHPVYSGKYQMISPEFPLKKDNNQSTNIDFLLVNNSRKTLVLFELKTDVGSIGTEQMEIYFRNKELISKRSAKALKDDLLQISHASKGSKYENIVENFDKVISNPSDIRNSIIIYLAPNAKKVSSNSNLNPDFIMAFRDLPETIEYKYSDFWTVIRNNLVQLDNISERKEIKELSYEERGAVIVSNIKSYVIGLKSGIKPLCFQIGILGDGSNPNYQVKFSDGSIRTFRFNGNLHHIPIFHNKNLSKEVLWVEN